MIRKTFEHEIQLVKDEVLLLGSMVEHAIITSVEVLKKRDIKGAEKVIAEDKEINKKRFAIENQLMILIATLTATLITSSGRSAWFVGVLALMVYLIFAMTLYMLPPQA
mgnify:CR=1 FL=1